MSWLTEYDPKRKIFSKKNDGFSQIWHQRNEKRTQKTRRRRRKIWKRFKKIIFNFWWILQFSELVEGKSKTSPLPSLRGGALRRYGNPCYLVFQVDCFISFAMTKEIPQWGFFLLYPSLLKRGQGWFCSKSRRKFFIKKVATSGQHFFSWEILHPLAPPFDKGGML